MKYSPPPEPVYHLSRLRNGLTVCTFPMPWLHEVGATLLVRAGSRYETEEEAGIAHFLEHMVFKGTTAIPDPTALHIHLEALAADMNAATSQEYNAYWITLPPSFLEEGFATFCTMFTAPALRGIDTERQVIVAEMREEENDQGEITTPALLAGTVMWPGHPLARSILGTRARIAGIDEAALRRFLARYYCGRNMAVAFFGPIAHRRALRLTRTALGMLPAGVLSSSPPPPPMPPGPHWVAVNDQTAQLSLVLYFRTTGFLDANHDALGAMRRILDDGFASRLQATLRERQGLVYDLWAAYTALSDTGCLEVGAAVSPENLEAVFVAIIAQLAGLCDAPPPDDEWRRVLTRWQAALMSTLDRPAELMERYVADRLFAPIETLATAWRRVRAIDPESLPALARRLIAPHNMVVVLVGPEARAVLPRLRANWQTRGETDAKKSGGLQPAGARQ
ncbi:MAG: insulinase family protein [Magnetococcales bacterium]|nr:insulinase family protein [Magnetococcales bacterium]